MTLGPGRVRAGGRPRRHASQRGFEVERRAIAVRNGLRMYLGIDDVAEDGAVGRPRLGDDQRAKLPSGVHDGLQNPVGSPIHGFLR
jgi:hypothetical protein